MPLDDEDESVAWTVQVDDKQLIATNPRDIAWLITLEKEHPGTITMYRVFDPFGSIYQGTHHGLFVQALTAFARGELHRYRQLIERKNDDEA
jgi:hypothetical protein